MIEPQVTSPNTPLGAAKVHMKYLFLGSIKNGFIGNPPHSSAQCITRVKLIDKTEEDTSYLALNEAKQHYKAMEHVLALNIKKTAFPISLLFTPSFKQMSFTYRQHQDSSRGSWKTISTRKTRTTRRTLRWKSTHVSKTGTQAMTVHFQRHTKMSTNPLSWVSRTAWWTRSTWGSGETLF